MATITFDPEDWAPETLVAIANAMSEDIDRFARDCSASLDRGAYKSIQKRLTLTFHEVCIEIERQGLVLSDHVRCPTEG